MTLIMFLQEAFSRPTWEDSETHSLRSPAVDLFEIFPTNDEEVQAFTYDGRRNNTAWCNEFLSRRQNVRRCREEAEDGGGKRAEYHF